MYSQLCLCCRSYVSTNAGHELFLPSSLLSFMLSCCDKVFSIACVRKNHCIDLNSCSNMVTFCVVFVGLKVARCFSFSSLQSGKQREWTSPIQIEYFIAVRDYHLHEFIMFSRISRLEERPLDHWPYFILMICSGAVNTIWRCLRGVWFFFFLFLFH